MNGDAHVPVVTRAPIGPAPKHPRSQRYGTALACSCGWDAGVVSDYTRIKGGAVVAARHHREHLTHVRQASRVLEGT
ncbi:MAG: hypothetical protein ACRD0V_07210 [Acidimicrobiales bacterium]